MAEKLFLLFVGGIASFRIDKLYKTLYVTCCPRLPGCQHEATLHQDVDYWVHLGLYCLPWVAGTLQDVIFTSSNGDA